MKDRSAAADNIVECFRAGGARRLVTRPLSSAQLSITHVRRDYVETDRTVALPADDAFLVVLYLVDVHHRDVWPDRPPAPLKLYPQGSICLINLKQGAAIVIDGRFEALVFHIPYAHLAELADRAGEPRVEDLAICRGMDDHTVRDLGAALLPLLDAEDRQDALVAHIGLALNAHIAHRYGRPRRTH